MPVGFHVKQPCTQQRRKAHSQSCLAWACLRLLLTSGRMGPPAGPHGGGACMAGSIGSAGGCHFGGDIVTKPLCSGHATSQSWHVSAGTDWIILVATDGGSLLVLREEPALAPSPSAWTVGISRVNTMSKPCKTSAAGSTHRPLVAAKGSPRSSFELDLGILGKCLAGGGPMTWRVRLVDHGAGGRDRGIWPAGCPHLLLIHHAGSSSPSASVHAGIFAAVGIVGARSEPD